MTPTVTPYHRVLDFAFAQDDAVDHFGGGGVQIKVVFAGARRLAMPGHGQSEEPLLDDFEAEQAEKPAAQAEAQRGAAFHFKAEADIVEAQAGTTLRWVAF